MQTPLFFAVSTNTYHIISTSTIQNNIKNIVEKSNGKLEILTEEQLNNRFSKEFKKIFFLKLPLCIIASYAILYSIIL